MKARQRIGRAFIKFIPSLRLKRRRTGKFALTAKQAPKFKNTVNAGCTLNATNWSSPILSNTLDLHHEKSGLQFLVIRFAVMVGVT